MLTAMTLNSDQLTSRYIVRPAVSFWYVFDQQQSPMRTIAVCQAKADAERVRIGLEVLDLVVAETEVSAAM